jgi:CRISPR-associated protein Cas2
MPRHRDALSGYRLMWLFVMFDLPVETRAQRREYQRFRTKLERRGFVRLQLSIYAEHCASDEAVEAEMRFVKGCLPPEGQVRVLAVTDRQWGRMAVFWGGKAKPVEDPPAQLALF